MVFGGNIGDLGGIGAGADVPTTGPGATAALGAGGGTSSATLASSVRARRLKGLKGRNLIRFLGGSVPGRKTGGPGTTGQPTPGGPILVAAIAPFAVFRQAGRAVSQFRAAQTSPTLRTRGAIRRAAAAQAALAVEADRRQLQRLRALASQSPFLSVRRTRKDPGLFL